MRKLLFITMMFFALQCQSQLPVFNGCAACSEVLKQDYYSQNYNFNEVISYAETISKETFEKLQKSTSTGGTLFKIVNASHDYDEFRENIQKYKRDIRFYSNTNIASTTLEYKTNPVAYSVWLECVKLNCSDKKFTAIPTVDDKDNFGVQIKYKFEGDAETKQRVKFEITQNGVTKTKIETINPGAFIPYDFARVFDTKGKSNFKIKIQCIDKKNVPIYDGYTYYSKFFQPNIAFTDCSVFHSESLTGICYSKDKLEAGGSELHNISCDIFEDHCKQGIGYHSADGKWLGVSLETSLIADSGYYFENPNDLNLITFRPLNNDNDGQWNERQFSTKSEAAVITSATPTLVRVRFLGSASGYTAWQVFRPKTQISETSSPILINYVDKNTIQFSVPLSNLKGAKIFLNTAQVGTFTIEEKDFGLFNYTDARGFRYFKIKLDKLIEKDGKAPLFRQLLKLQ